MAGNDFNPAWWLPGPHLQTLWQPMFRREPRPETRRERIGTPDDDFIDLDWLGPEDGPVVLLLHGLSGSSRSPYMRGLQDRMAAGGWRTVAMNFRGCGGQPNQTSRGYHSGETGDFDWVVRVVRQRYPDKPLSAVGFSLGGNVLLKWLGEHGAGAELVAAAAVSVPLRLDLCAKRLNRGVSRLYRDRLLRELKDYIAGKSRYLKSLGREEEARHLAALGDLSSIRSFWEYDDRVVAKLYGFRDADDYYDRSSSRRYLRRIRRPTLVVQARDDPFMTPEALPDPDELSSAVQLEITSGGGHVGFISGRLPFRPDYWLERRIPDFLTQAMGSD
jgi:predicted alpha/beta-fold hydrolase